MRLRTLTAGSPRSKSLWVFAQHSEENIPGEEPGTLSSLSAQTLSWRIVAPDPDQPPPKEPRPFFKGLTESQLVRWFINSRDITRIRDEAVSKGVPYGEVKPGSRQRPDGVQVSWQFTDPAKPVADGVVPFIIDWGDTPHPSQSAAKGATLISLRAEHPDPREAKRLLLALALKVPVKKAKRPALIATIEGPRGRVELK